MIYYLCPHPFMDSLQKQDQRIHMDRNRPRRDRSLLPLYDGIFYGSCRGPDNPGGHNILRSAYHADSKVCKGIRGSAFFHSGIHHCLDNLSYIWRHL